MKFLTFFKENFRIFQKIPKRFSENAKFEFLCIFMFQQAKHVHAKFQLSSFYLDGIRYIFDLFSFS
jgi:hypothetical protein